MLGGLIGWPLAQAPEILAFHREQTRSAPDELGISTAFVTAPPLPFVPESLQFQPAVAVILCWSGDIDEGREVVRPWLDLAPPIQMVDAMPYTVMQTLQDDLAPPGRHSYWKSGYLAELTDDAIAAAAGVAAAVPSPFSLAEIVLWGGAVARVRCRRHGVRAAGRSVPLQRGFVLGGPGRDRAERRVGPELLRRPATVRDGGRLRELLVRRR